MKHKVERYQNMVDYQSDSIVSHKVLESQGGGVTVFAFDQDQRLSEHTAPFDAIVLVLEGEAEIMLDGEPHLVQEGEHLLMPAGIPHGVYGRAQFKMLLTMIRK